MPQPAVIVEWWGPYDTLDAVRVRSKRNSRMGNSYCAWRSGRRTPEAG